MREPHPLTETPWPRVRKRLVQIGLLLAATIALLLLSAGRADWFWAWIYLGLMAASAVTIGAVLLARGPETVAARSAGAAMADWDRWIGGGWAVAFLIVLPVVAGLDARLGWSPVRPGESHVGGALMYVSGSALIGWALACNAFFVTGARLQPERGQTVCSSGPYRLVRHPGYLAALLHCLAVPVLLGSLWALIPGAAAAALVFARTAREDRILQDGLDGYRAYARAVGYRLIPGLW